MSIIWLETFTEQLNNDHVLVLDKLNAFIYLNILPVILFFIYFLLYRMDVYMRKPPNSLIILKMFGEWLVSLLFLALFLNFSLKNQRKASSYDKFAHLISIFSPFSLFLVYYFNICLAHNLFKTVFSYKNNYEKRMKLYKVFAVLLSIVIIILSLVFNTHSETKVLVMAYYNIYFIAVYYTFGFAGIIYIIYIVLCILTNDSGFPGKICIKVEAVKDKKKEIITTFIRKQILFLSTFVICYLPNNVIVLSEIIMKARIDNSNLIFSVYLISLSCTASIIIKITDPYTKKYFKHIATVIFRSNKDIPLITYPNEKNTDPDYVDSEFDIYHDNKLLTNRSGIFSPHRQIASSRSFKGISPIRIKLDNLTRTPSQFTMVELQDRKEDPITPLPEIVIKEEPKEEDETKADIEAPIEPSTIANDNYDFSKQGSINYLSTMVYGMENYVIERLKEEYLFRFKGIVLSLDEEKIYDTSPIYIEKAYEKPLPWRSRYYYEEATDFKEYNYKHCPYYIESESEKFKSTSIQLKKYAPLVFHIIRKIDGIKIEEFKDSLSPQKNKEKITQSFASGGNSDNPIIYTHDRKYLIKSISRSEKEMLIRILPEYHQRMKEGKSFICRIYGLYSIMINNKEQAYVIVMRNMCDLSSNMKIVSFDLKGSSVNRSELTIEERIQVNNNKVAEVIPNLKNRVLKDTDFKELGIKLLVMRKDYDFLLKNIQEDMMFLHKYNITDYSLLINLHYFNEEECSKVLHNYRVFKSFDNDYLYTFSIIDFITEYDIMKKGEKVAKSLTNFSDTNFSCQNPDDYYKRLIEHIKTNIFSVKD